MQFQKKIEAFPFSVHNLLLPCDIRWFESLQANNFNCWSTFPELYDLEHNWSGVFYSWRPFFETAWTLHIFALTFGDFEAKSCLIAFFSLISYGLCTSNTGACFHDQFICVIIVKLRVLLSSFYYESLWFTTFKPVNLGNFNFSDCESVLFPSSLHSLLANLSSSSSCLWLLSAKEQSWRYGLPL